MKKQAVLLFLFVFIVSNVSFAQSYTEKVKNMAFKLRPYVEKIVGEEIAIKIFGEKTIQLPVIPKIVQDARADNGKAIEVVKLSKQKSQKYDLAFCTELFSIINNMNIGGSGIDSCFNVLQQGGSREGVYRSIVLDSDYRRLENLDERVTIQALEFSINFLKKFINIRVKKEKMGTVNTYTLKKYCVEKALELIDMFGNDNSNLYDWYAVFSKELAEKYPIFKNKLRKKTSAKIHQNWASKAPRQHLKSEVIIKLHLVFNSMF